MIQASFSSTTFIRLQEDILFEVPSELRDVGCLLHSTDAHERLLANKISLGLVLYKLILVAMILFSEAT